MEAQILPKASTRINIKNGRYIVLCRIITVLGKEDFVFLKVNTLARANTKFERVFLMFVQLFLSIMDIRIRSFAKKRWDSVRPFLEF